MANEVGVSKRLTTSGQVYQSFYYFSLDKPSMNIVDLMNHLSFGGDPFQRMQDSMDMVKLLNKIQNN